MALAYTPVVTWAETVPILEDAVDDDVAASYNAPIQAIADRTAYLDGGLALLGGYVDDLLEYAIGPVPAIEVSSFFDNGDTGSPADIILAGATSVLRTWQPAGLVSSARTGDLYVVSIHADVTLSVPHPANEWSASRLEITNNISMPSFRVFCGTQLGTNNGVSVSATQSMVYTGAAIPSGAIQFYVSATNGSTSNLHVIALRMTVTRFNKYQVTP